MDRSLLSPRAFFASLNPFQRSLVSAFSGLVGYGGWAYLVNSMHGSFAGFKAACVQGSYSFLLTFVMTMMIEGLYRFMSELSDTEQFNKLATIVVTCAIIFSTSWWVNAMAGTPEIFNTVILGYIIGGVYTISYVIGLSREKMQKLG
ncbi:MAG: hypothetical protein AAF431_01555 [Pseudomonadota bacterium]